MSALLGLQISYARVPCSSLHCMLLDVLTERAFQPVKRRYMFLFFDTRLKALWYGREAERLHRQDLRSVLWENLYGICPVSHKCWVPAICRDVFLSIFLFLFFLYAICLLLRSKRAMHHNPLSFPCAPLKNTTCLMAKCSHNHFLQTTSQNIM